MSTTISDLVEKTRSMIWGTSFDERNVLAQPYTAGDTDIWFEEPQTGLGHGSLVCVGLNTFYVLRPGSDQRSARVIPAADGGPTVDANQGTICIVKPRITTWAIWRELHDAIADMGSPWSGLYQPISFETAYNWRGFYAFPAGWTEAAQQPQRYIRGRYRTSAIENWLPIFNAEWLVERYAVQVLDQTPDARTYEFTFGYAYRTPEALDDELFDLGLTERSTQNLPPLRAASRLMLGMEGQRVQPRAQGDSRRPTEVPPASNTSLSREWKRAYDEGVLEERSRLQRLFSYTLPIGER